MTHHKVIVRLPMDSGIPQDAAVNTWHCNTLPGNPSGYENFVADLETFYKAVDNQLGSVIDATGITATVYDMTDDTPRAPVYTYTFSGIATSTTTSPQELAICVSFQGTRLSGQSQSRRRGRVFLGPLGGGLAASTTDMHIDPSIVSQFATAAGALCNTALASTDYAWVVYSKADEDLVIVHSGWVDNAFDVQRRRGVAATARTTFTGAP